MDRLFERFRALPRAARWGVIAVAALALYFPLVEWPLDRSGALNARADAYENRLELARRSWTAAGDVDTRVSLGLSRHGDARPPGAREARADALERAIAAIMDAQGVTGHTITSRAGPSAAWSGERRVQSLIKDLRFTASPDRVASVLARIEQSPEVSGVSRVVMTRGDGTMVDAEVSVFAWAEASAGVTR